MKLTEKQIDDLLTESIQKATLSPQHINKLLSDFKELDSDADLYDLGISVYSLSKTYTEAFARHLLTSLFTNQ